MLRSTGPQSGTTERLSHGAVQPCSPSGADSVRFGCISLCYDTAVKEVM